MQHNGWDYALKVTADGSGLVGHVGAVLLRKVADQAGLTGQLSAAVRKAGMSPLLDRGIVLVSMAVRIARARAYAWQPVEDTRAGFPWLVIAGKALTGWLVIDLDATLVTASLGQGRRGSHLEEGLRSTHWVPSSPIPPSAWPRSCGPGTPGQTRSATTRRC
jgi:hypothetical protein